MVTSCYNVTDSVTGGKIMNLGIESETLEFKKSTGEIEKAISNIASMLNKHGHVSPTVHTDSL